MTKAGPFRRWMPGLQTLLTYERGWLRRDLVAGVALSAFLVPVGMGYAQASGLPAVYGLYATIVPLVVYGLLGPSRILVLGPDSALAPMIAATILPAFARQPRSRACARSCARILTGGFLVLIGVMRFGYVTDLLSLPIRYGYLNGIAFTVIVSQLPGCSASRWTPKGCSPVVAFIEGVVGARSFCLRCWSDRDDRPGIRLRRLAPIVPAVLVAVVPRWLRWRSSACRRDRSRRLVAQGLPSFELPLVDAPI